MYKAHYWTWTNSLEEFNHVRTQTVAILYLFAKIILALVAGTVVTF